ncbi:MAG: DUF2333 family protein [Acidimicrobiia bacterium]|nr:DUF2333 family protein [Acidimicrobiia bacterium]MDH5505276.1 DUF2333 family protein [Acidimicrobiia bacterium]
MQPIDDGERVEFVPWEQLRPRQRPTVTAQQRFLAIAGAVCVALVVAGWWWSNRPDPAPVASESTPVATQAGTPVPLASTTTLAVTVPVTEADLRASAPASPELEIAAIASEYLRAYLSESTPEIHPYGTATTPTYVEWIGVISADVTDELQRWLVTMRVGLLELGDDPRRLPVSEYSVFVSMKDGSAVVSVPIRRAGTRPDPVVVQHESLTDVPSTILEAAAIGPEEEILGGWEAAGRWYVMVLDERGLPVAVEVSTP